MPTPSPKPRVAAPTGTLSTHGGPGDAPATTPPDDFPFLDHPQQPDEIGRLGGYRVLGVLGRGGMGLVFAAEDPALRRQIALKVMLPKFAADSAAKARFVREARAQAAVEHDHVITVFQVAEAGGVPFLAMPLLKGMTLADALKTGIRCPVPEALRIAREMADGLAAAHEKGLIHRDIKPANVWLEGKGRRVKILDFGLARAADEAAGGDDHVTASGAVLGTPAYMSPEQANGHPVDARTDLFSLGTVLYELLAGRRPFQGATTPALLVAVAYETPPPPSALNPEVPPDLDGVVGWLMAKDPAGRPSSARAAATALRRDEDGPGRTGSVPAAAPDDWSELVAAPLADGSGAETILRGRSAAERGRQTRAPALLLGAAAGLMAVVTAAVVVVRMQTGGGAEPTTVAGGEQGPPPRSPKAKPPAEPPHAAVPLPVRVVTLPHGPSPYDALDPAGLPEDPGVHWRPKELVGVFGTGSGMHWGKPVTQIHLTQDGKTLVTSSQDGTIAVRDAETGRVRKVFEHSLTAPYWSAPFAVSPDGRWLVYRRHPVELVVWDLAADREAARVPDQDVWQLEFTRAGARLIGRVGTTVRVYTPGSWAVERTFPIPAPADLAPPVHFAGMAASPDGERVAVGWRNEKAGRCQTFTLPDGKPVSDVETPYFDIVFGFMPSGREVITRSYSENHGTVGLIDTATGKTVNRIARGQVHSAVPSPDGRTLLVGTFGGISRWPIDGAAAEWEQPALNGETRTAVSGDGSRGAVNGTDGKCVVFDAKTGAVVPWPGVIRTFPHPLPLADGRVLVLPAHTASAPPGSVWDVTAPARPPRPVPLPDGWHDLTARPDGLRVAIADYDRRGFRVLATDDALTETASNAVDFPITAAMAYTPDGRALAVGRKDGQITLLDPATLQPTRTMGDADGQQKWSLAFTPDGTRLAATGPAPDGGAPPEVEVRDAATGALRDTLDPGGPTPFVAISPTAPVLAAASHGHHWDSGPRDPQLRVWDLSSRPARALPLENPKGAGGRAVAFSPDGKELAAGSISGMVYVWAVPLGELKRSIRVGPPFGWISEVAYTPDGRHLVTANGNGTVYVLRLAPPTAPPQDFVGPRQ